MPGLGPRKLVAAAFAAWMVSVAIGLVFGAPLTSDEAAYALLARGDGADWLYRSRGVVAIARVGIALGGSDIALRLVPMLVSGTLVLAVAAVGRRAFGPWVGAGSAAVIAGAHPFVLRGFELLGDLPATACLLAAIAVVVGELERARGPTYRLVLAAPLCAAALYVRYGSAIVIALVGLAAIVTWWRELRARPGPALVTVAVLAVLVAPFVVESIRATGSPIGILELSSKVSGHTWFGRGLLVYLFADPFRSYGALVPTVMLAGLWSLRTCTRPARFLASIAIGQIIALGLTSHASSRFVFVAIALLVVLGVDLLARTVTSPRARRCAAIAVIASWAGTAIAIPLVERHFARGLAPLMASASAIRADAAARPCTIVARALPQLMWYSGCAGWKLVGDARPPVVDTQPWYAASAPRRPIDPLTLGATARAIAPETWALTSAARARR